MSRVHRAERQKTSGTTICECLRRTRGTPQISTAPPQMISHRGLMLRTFRGKLLRLTFLAPSCETKVNADIWQTGEWQGQILDRKNTEADTVVRMRPLWTKSPEGEVASVSAGPVRVRVCVCVCTCVLVCERSLSAEWRQNNKKKERGSLHCRVGVKLVRGRSKSPDAQYRFSPDSESKVSSCVFEEFVPLYMSWWTGWWWPCHILIHAFLAAKRRPMWPSRPIELSSSLMSTQSLQITQHYLSTTVSEQNCCSPTVFYTVAFILADTLSLRFFNSFPQPQPICLICRLKKPNSNVFKMCFFFFF